MKFCYSCGKELVADSKFCNNCGANILTPGMPKEEERQVSQSKPEKKHTTFAKVWIGLMLIALIISMFLYLTAGNQIARAAKIPQSMISILILIGLGMIILLIFLYTWKRWAFYGLCGLGIIIFLLKFFIGFGATSIMGLIGIAILYLSIRSEWNLYE